MAHFEVFEFFPVAQGPALEGRLMDFLGVSNPTAAYCFEALTKVGDFKVSCHGQSLDYVVGVVWSSQFHCTLKTITVVASALLCVIITETPWWRLRCSHDIAWLQESKLAMYSPGRSFECLWEEEGLHFPSPSGPLRTLLSLNAV